MDSLSYLSNADPALVDNLYQQYKQNPTSVDITWQKFFEGFEFSKSSYDGADGATAQHMQKEFKVMGVIMGYRVRGHLFTQTNPVRARRKYYPDDSIENFGLEQSDLDTVFQAGDELGIGPATLREIVAHLKETYCQSIGAEYKYIRHPKVIKWFEDKMEGSKNHMAFTKKDKKHILHKLNQAVAFENFIHTKFTGQKRFSLEGAETLIPALDAVIEFGADTGIQEYVIGMSHRGRLNILANILKKSYEDIFFEFEGKNLFEEEAFDGDVKYHLGYSSDIKTSNKKDVHLYLTPNPSHLEAVGPVVQGITRAKIDNKYDGDNKKIAPILIHGDAAIAGQGVVYELIQMSLLKGYGTGGTIHLVINNQIGFTTNYIDARSSTYCTDVAKVTLSPVFHVNGDDVEALIYTIKLAMEYRQTFHRDVFIDILCYRKYGHNEGDEPRFTQPLLYKAIAQHDNPREIYYQKLLAEGSISESDKITMEREFKEMLEISLDTAKKKSVNKALEYKEGMWTNMSFPADKDFLQSPDTGFNKKKLTEIADLITSLPEDKSFFKKTIRLFNDRKKMLDGQGKLDWAMGELMAYATLINEGHPVRVSGQDSQRGTFSHRHAVITIEDSEEQYWPINGAGKEPGLFRIYNSHLSEYGVMGFEYGYASSTPQGLTVWEAQFGDFANGAQIIIDQFIATAQDKWKRMNGLVLLLPHGYEGQGAEHSSARMERFLNLSAQNNIYVVNCTTPASFFHVLRRQLKTKYRMPLVVFTPKSLLRHPRVNSTLNELATGKFQEVIDDANANPAKVKKLVFCQGKIYYDLLERQESTGNTDIAVVRIEQLYPLPQKQLNDIIAKYKNAKHVQWVQEEPENMGAWGFLLRKYKGSNLECISRPESASPASGSSKKHEKQQKAIIDKVFGSVQTDTPAKAQHAKPKTKPSSKSKKALT